MDDAALAAWVEANAAALGLAIPPECRPGVLEHAARMHQLAALVMTYPLPAEVEPAAVFRAQGR
jgi:hypothetical protein